MFQIGKCQLPSSFTDYLEDSNNDLGCSYELPMMFQGGSKKVTLFFQEAEMIFKEHGKAKNPCREPCEHRPIQIYT